MMGVEIKFASDRDIQQNDNSPFNKFADLTLPANVPVRVGELELPANIQAATWGGGPLYIVLFDNATTAARIEGLFIFKAVDPDGKEKVTHRIPSQLAGASGQASTPSEWHIMARGAKGTVGGGKLAIDFVAITTAVMDTTDNAISSMPYTIVTA